MPRGFGFVHHSRTSSCRAVPNPNLTIRHFCIAVPRVRRPRPEAVELSLPRLHHPRCQRLRRPPPPTLQSAVRCWEAPRGVCTHRSPLGYARLSTQQRRFLPLAAGELTLRRTGAGKRAAAAGWKLRLWRHCCTRWYVSQLIAEPLTAGLAAASSEPRWVVPVSSVRRASASRGSGLGAWACLVTARECLRPAARCSPPSRASVRRT